jgi:hypothetical protein
MNNNLKTPAFPCILSQDQFGQIYAPIPGFNKFEYAVLMIMASKESHYNTVSDLTLVRDSIRLANEYFKQLNELNNEKDEKTLSILK